MTFGVSNSFAKVIFLTLFILVAFVIVASYLLVLLMGYGFIFFTLEGFSIRAFNFYVLVLLAGFYLPTELSVGPVFSFIWIVFALCFVAAWKWRESFHNVVAKSFSRPFRGIFGNFLFIMPLISSMILTAVLAIIYSQQFVGIPTGEVTWPEGTPVQKIFLDLAYAPVIEEVGFRLIPMGLFTMFYVFSAGKNVAARGFKLLIASIFYPEGAKRLAGLRSVGEHGIWRGISPGEWAMIITTAVIFGFAHIISESGWEAGKITSVFVQGFFFTLTYIAYGFEAPILLHWFFNYYLFFFDPYLAAKFFPTTEPIFSLIELIILAMGIAGWIMFAIAGLRVLLRRRTIKQVVPAPPAPPSTWPS